MQQSKLLLEEQPTPRKWKLPSGLLDRYLCSLIIVQETRLPHVSPTSPPRLPHVSPTSPPRLVHVASSDFKLLYIPNLPADKEAGYDFLGMDERTLDNNY